jgi:predicted GTPase
MAFGAGVSAAKKLALELVDPRPYAVGSLKQVYQKYPHIENVLPAMGYSEEQVKDLEETIRHTPCDAVVIATPADLRRSLKIEQPVVRVFYDFDIDLSPLIDHFLNQMQVIS